MVKSLYLYLFILFCTWNQAFSLHYEIIDLGIDPTKVSYATSINEKGEVAGFFITEEKHDFKWTPEDGFAVDIAKDKTTDISRGMGFFIAEEKYNFKWTPEDGLTVDIAKDKTTDIYWGMGPFIDDCGNLSDHPKVQGEEYFIEQEKLYKISVNGKKELLDKSLKWQKQIPYDKNDFNWYIEYVARTPLKVNQNKVVLGETDLGPVVFSTIDNKKFFLKDYYPNNLRLHISKASDINDFGDVTLWGAGGNRDGDYLMGSVWNGGLKYGSIEGFLPLLINNEETCVARDYVYDFSPGNWNFDVHLKEPWVKIEGVLDINDKGQIVGFGKTTDGKPHAILLNPTN